MGNDPSKSPENSKDLENSGEQAPPKPALTRVSPTDIASFISKAEFLDEFDYLKKLAAYELSCGKLGPMQEARKPENAPKNRYNDIVPYDNCRVVLPGGRYINASYIDDLATDRKKCYICTQGPMDKTIADFWEMIWHEKTGLIIMLTRLVEDGKPKVELYWPNKEKEPTTFGDVVVTLIEVSEPAKGIIKRKFKVSSNSEVRNVYQFQYEAWPDHGVPDETDSIRGLMKVVHIHKTRLSPEQQGSPVVVHCSAGVGRTGTFICVDMVQRTFRRWLKKGKNPEEFKFNLVDVVTVLRSQRRGMVQSSEQYGFCYELARDFLTDLIEENKKKDSGAVRRSRDNPGSRDSTG